MRIVFFILCLLITLVMVTGLTNADTDSPGLSSMQANISYVTLNQLAQKYNLKHEKDYLTGREVFSGNGYNIVASSGMSSILVNNKLAVLEEKLKSVNGQLALSSKDFPKIESLLIGPYHKNSTKRKAKGIIRKVVIDPGHGGCFRGCKGKTGLLEKEVNLDVAKRLRDLLEEKGVKVIMTRTTDRSLSANLNEDLRRRVDIANREQPDLFLSIHCNYSDNASVKGFEIYYSSENNTIPSLSSSSLGEEKPNDRQTQKALSYVLKDEYSKRTLEIAKGIKKQFNKLPTEDRGVRKANFKVIKYSEIPSILVEMDFLSNKSVSNNFHKDSYRQDIAEKIMEAITSYKQAQEE